MGNEEREVTLYLFPQILATLSDEKVREMKRQNSKHTSSVDANHSRESEMRRMKNDWEEKWLDYGENEE